MDTEVEDAIQMADKDNPYKVSGRCSVFCKSDCTHALNKGSGKEKIIAGLCEMMAGKVLELIKATKTNEIMVIGGLSKNTTMLHYLEKDIEKLYRDWETDRKSTRLNSSHITRSRMPSSA